MANVSISLNADEKPDAYVLGQHSTDGPFVTMTFGGLSVYLPGYGPNSAASARALAAALIAAADEVDALMAVPAAQEVL